MKFQELLHPLLGGEIKRRRATRKPTSKNPEKISELSTIVVNFSQSAEVNGEKNVILNQGVRAENFIFKAAYQAV